MPSVGFGEFGDAAQTIIEQDALDAGWLETQVAEIDIIHLFALVLELVSGGLSILHAKELGQLRGRTITGQGVAGVLG